MSFPFPTSALILWHAVFHNSHALREEMSLCWKEGQKCRLIPAKGIGPSSSADFLEVDLVLGISTNLRGSGVVEHSCEEVPDFCVQFSESSPASPALPQFRVWNNPEPVWSPHGPLT